MIQRFHMDTEQQNKKKDRTAVWCITPNGLVLGKKIRDSLGSADLFISKKLLSEIGATSEWHFFDHLGETIKLKFHEFSGHVFIFSTGIAVRLIAQLLLSKTRDPAVVVMDDTAEHAVSLISGHLGGANELAETIGKISGAKPVITTATDSNNLPSIDMVAKKAGLVIETPENIKHINMAFLKGEKITVNDPMELVKPWLPQQYYTCSGQTDKNKSVLCSHEVKLVSRETLVLRPRILSVGIGCNRDTPFTVIKNFFDATLEKHQFSQNSIYRLATTEVKKDELGLLELSKTLNIGIDFYDKDQLNSVTSIQTPSKMVEKHLGVKSVCEAAAILSATRERGNITRQGQLILAKQKNKDVTLAVAIET